MTRRPSQAHQWLVFAPTPALERVVTTALGLSGRRASLCTTRRAARELLTLAGSPALALLDLAGKEGWELLAELRAQRLPVKVLALLPAGAIIDGALERGADDFIRAPFDEQALAARLRVLERTLALPAQGPPDAAEPEPITPEEPGLDLRRWRAVTEDCGEALFLSRMDTGALVDVNQTACQWLGVARETLLATPALWTSSGVPRSHGAWSARARDAADAGVSVQHDDDELVATDGTRLRSSTLLTVRTHAGVSYLLAAVHAVAVKESSQLEARRRAAQTQAAFDATSAALTLTRSSDGRIIHGNRASTSLLQVSELSEERPSGPRFFADPGLRVAMYERLRRHGRVGGVVVEVVASDGTHHHVLMSATLTEVHGELLIVTAALELPEVTSEPPARAQPQE